MRKIGKKTPIGYYASDLHRMNPRNMIHTLQGILTSLITPWMSLLQQRCFLVYGIIGSKNQQVSNGSSCVKY